ncbi:hypothetical protein A7K97_18095 [Salmonella enterica]|nr:hypothetical protein A7K97_18095 [Salmonella enterica]
MVQVSEHIHQQHLIPPAKQTLKYNRINEYLFLIQQVVYFSDSFALIPSLQQNRVLKQTLA